MKHGLILLLALTYSLLGSAAHIAVNDSLFVLIVVPEQDTTLTDAARYRISGSTNPGNQLTVNGTAFDIFQSGAFGGLLELSVGVNRFLVVATDGKGKMVSKSLHIHRRPPMVSTPRDSLGIEDTLMEPSADVWLTDGDVLMVQFKGTPGCKATFLDGQPMTEQPASSWGGVEGIYRGIFKVTGADTFINRPVPFRLEDSTGQFITGWTKAPVWFRQHDVPLVAVTKGARSYLNTGLGTDRLGGTRLTYLTEGVRLAVMGKAQRQYRIALTENMEAWIPEEMVEVQPQGTFPPSSLTGSIRVFGDTDFDYVEVALNERLPYSTSTEPGRIVLDIYGAVSNTNWITNALTAKEIANVYYSQAEKNLFRLTVELKNRQVWGYGVEYLGTTLTLRVKRQPESLDLSRLSIAIDAGHGGDNKGSVGSTGTLEKDATLAITKKLHDALANKGSRVIMTRMVDTSLSNWDRLSSLLKKNPDILVSIHANSVGFTTNPLTIQGASTYYKYNCYRPLSMYILDELLKTGLKSFGNVGNFNFYLNSPTEFPNVLVEVAFMSHPEDEMKLLDPEFQSEVTDRIVDGIESFLESCEE